MTNRVVVTGLGIVSSLGNASEVVASCATVSPASAIRPQEEIGMRSVTGRPDIDLSEHDRKQWRFMGDVATF